MKVIHIIPSLAQGGAESQLERLIKYSQKVDVVHVVISLTNQQTPLMNRLIEENIQVNALEFGSIHSTIKGIFKLRKIIKQEMDSDTVIQCWMYHANLIGLLIAKTLGLSEKVVWNIRRTEVPKGLTGFISILSAKISQVLPVKIVCCADAAKESHIKAKYNPVNMMVIHNGIDVDLFSPNISYGAYFRDELDIKEDEFVIGMVGRYAPIKGHIYLLEAFKLLLTDNKSINTNIKLVLVGRDIESADILQPLLADPLLKDSLIILSERADVYKIFPAFDLLCLPSKSEGFPNVVAEAMACGVPALVTDVGDAAIIVGNPNMVVPPLDSEALAKHIQCFIRLTDKNKTELGQQARERVLNLFSVNNTWKQYGNLYNKIVGNI